MSDVPHGGDGDPERTDALETTEAELVELFRRVRSFAFEVAAKVHPGLDPAAYGLMAVIDNIGVSRGSDLVERLGLDKSTVSRQVDVLVKRGIAERVPDPTDGRARLIQLTEQGRQEMREVRRERHRRLQDHFTDWSASDLRQLASWLSRLNDSL